MRKGYPAAPRCIEQIVLAERPHPAGARLVGCSQLEALGYDSLVKAELEFSETRLATLDGRLRPL